MPLLFIAIKEIIVLFIKFLTIISFFYLKFLPIAIGLSVFLIFIYTCKDLVSRIQTRKYFYEELRISKESFILIHSFKTNVTYNLIGLAFDIWLFFKKKTYADFNFYLSILLFCIVFSFFIFLPLCYLVLFLFHLIALWSKWFKAIITKTESVSILELDSPSFIKMRAFKFVFYGYLELPRIYAFLINYVFLARKTNKFSVNIFYNMLSSYFLHAPLWFFNFVIFFTIFLYETLKSDIWGRKKKKVWFEIFLRYCQNFFHQRLWSTWFGLSIQFDKAKIVFSRKGVFLNPNHGEQIAHLISKCSNVQKPTIMIDSYVGGKRHSTEYSYETQIGLVYTSQKHVRIGETTLPTFKISANTPEQFGIFSILDFSAVEVYDWKNHIRFLSAMKASSFNYMTGASLRSKILSHRYPLIQLKQWVDKNSNGKFICKKDFVSVNQGSHLTIEEEKFVDDIIFQMKDCDIFNSLLKYKSDFFLNTYRNNIRFYHSIWEDK